VRVSAAGGIYQHPDREVPDTFFMTIEYPSKHTVVLASSMANRQGLPMIIRGHKATISFDGRGTTIAPEDEYQEEFKKMFGQTPLNIDRFYVNSEERANHMDNFIDCIRSRENPVLDVEFGYKVQVAITLGVTAYRENKVCYFDPATEKVIEKS
ncbi:gfo/Idh/MocA family oxidoreductase, partial [candidate division KSB1 bacterium]|nr:gfo/Idh/MocA family oxidoreductase [candidate division KSB1 bacterium]